MFDQALSIGTDAVTPGLFALALLQSWRSYRDDRRLRVWAPLAFGLALIYGLQALDTQYGLWPHYGLDYSTHMAFAVTMGAIAGQNPAWRYGIVAGLCGYALLMRYFHYHSFADMLSTTVAIAVPVLLVRAWRTAHG